MDNSIAVLPWYAQVVLLLFGGAGGLVSLIRWWFDRLDRQAAARIPKILQAWSEIHRILQNIRYETPAGRVVVVKIENGGQMPKLGGTLFSTVIFESYGSGRMGSKREAWQKRPVTDFYAHVVTQIYECSQEGQHYIVCRDNMPDGEPLRDTYDTDGVDMSVLYELYSTEGAYYYVALNFARPFEPDARFRELMRDEMRRLSTIFRRYGDVRLLAGQK